MSAPVRVLVVDDHEMFREMLVRALSEQPGLAVVAECGSVAEAIPRLRNGSVDLVLLDYDLRGERGAGLITWAVENGWKGRLLVVTAGVSNSDALWLIQHGVGGIFLKEHSVSDLVRAVRAVAAGGKWLDQQYLRTVMEAVAKGSAPEPAPLFTERERLTLRLIVQGLSNKEIAYRLSVSEAAVKATVQRLFDKVGVRTRGHLIRIAVQDYRHYL